MVKIKSEGNVPLDWKAEVKCHKNDKYDSNGCSAVLEVQEKDLVLLFWKGSHFNHYYTAVKCPCCGKYNRVKTPQPVFEKIDTEKNEKKAIFDGFSDR